LGLVGGGVEWGYGEWQDPGTERVSVRSVRSVNAVPRRAQSVGIGEMPGVDRGRWGRGAVGSEGGRRSRGCPIGK
jgi:hypothetical protein